MDNNFGVQKFLWWLAAYEESVIKDCKSDRFHATILGSIMLMVWIYVTLAWCFFFGTIADNPLVIITAGFFAGTFIVFFDRALIATLSTGNGNIISLVFRFVLAITLGIFLSQPMILKIYEPDIMREAQILADQKVLERKAELEKQYASELKNLAAQKSETETLLQTLKADYDKSKNEFRTEMDGQGGTKHWGYNTVAKQKEGLMVSDSIAYGNYKRTADVRLNKIQVSKDSITDLIAKELNVYKEENAKFGTLIQVEALMSLLKQDKTGSLQSRYYLLGIILTLVELSALIAKLFLRSPSYSAKINLQTEEEVRNSEVSKEILFSRLEQYKTKAVESEVRLANSFFDKAETINEQKLEELAAEMKGADGITFKAAWEKFRNLFGLQG